MLLILTSIYCVREKHSLEGDVMMRETTSYKLLDHYYYYVNNLTIN